MNLLRYAGVLCAFSLLCSPRQAHGLELAAIKNALLEGTPAARAYALEELERQRHELVSALVAKIKFSDPKKPEDELRIVHLLLALGSLRAFEEFDFLLNWLDFEGVDPDDPERMQRGGDVGNVKLWPARQALVKMGPCVVDLLLRALSATKRSSETTIHCGWIVHELLGAEGKKRIESFAATLTSKDERDRVLDSLIFHFFKE